MDESRKTRDLFLCGIALMYLFAFGSWFVQIPGLYGDEGILPVKSVLAKEAQHSSSSLFEKPSIIWVFLYYGFSPQTSMELICLAGVALSFLCLLFKSVRSMPVYFALWFLYYSFYLVGQTFIRFQWDILLLEAGFLTALVAPMTYVTSRSPLQRIPFFLVKWLLFRLMFASGVVKLTSHCPTWWGLSALNYHFETQCIASPLAWWAHQLPRWILQLGVVGTYVIEIALPFLFFCPVRRLRYIGIYGQVLLMVTIILTGNYNFFNFLTIVLCLSCVDDRHLAIYGFTPGVKKRSQFGTRNFQKLQKFLATFTCLATIAVYSYYTVVLFGLKLFHKGDFVYSKIEFSKRQFQQWVDEWTLTGIWIGAIFFAFEALHTLYLCLRNKGLVQKVMNAVKYIAVLCVCVYMFSISMVPHKTVSSNNRCWPIIHQWHSASMEFELVHSYGLFRSMTGVGGRPEVVILGAISSSGPWKEIEFAYKPGNTSGHLPWIIPHQPRLDWQMWFAALSQYQHNPWFVSLVDRLMRGNKEVIKLLGARYPFKRSPPNYIKAELYLYHFSLITKAGAVPKRVWTRKYDRGYLPVISKDQGDLKNFLKYHGLELTGSKKKKATSSNVESVLAMLRAYIELLQPHAMLWSLCVPVLVIMITKKFIANTTGK